MGKNIFLKKFDRISICHQKFLEEIEIFINLEKLLVKIYTHFIYKMNKNEEIYERPTEHERQSSTYLFCLFPQILNIVKRKNLLLINSE